ncbi:MAG: CapA family protein, partial [Candidatus Nealsonbacteria bacterium]
MTKFLFWLLFLIIISAAFASQFFISKSLEKVTIEPINQKTIKIILAGDIMLDRGVKYMIEKEGNGDFKFPFLKIADYLKTADIVFGNLEGPISDKGTKVGSIYSFRNDPRAIEGLTYAGFNVISLANNHAFDYGRIAFEDTVLRLKKAGIEAAGIGAPVIKEIDGTKIAFLAYTAFAPNQISKDDFSAITEEIKTTKQNADFLIVSLHAGEEYQ